MIVKACVRLVKNGNEQNLWLAYVHILLLNFLQCLCYTLVVSPTKNPRQNIRLRHRLLERPSRDVRFVRDNLGNLH